MKILRQVEIGVILMPIVFAQPQCYLLFSMKFNHPKLQYCTPLRGSILIQIKLFEPPQLRTMLRNWLSNLLRNEDFATGWNRCNFNANYFRSISMLSFGQYETKSSGPTPFRGSMLMQFKSLEPPQFPPHALQISLKSVEKWKFRDRLKSL